MRVLERPAILYSGCAVGKDGKAIRESVVALGKKLRLELWESHDALACPAHVVSHHGGAITVVDQQGVSEAAHQQLRGLVLSPVCASALTANHTELSAVMTVLDVLSASIVDDPRAHSIVNPLHGVNIAVHAYCHASHAAPSDEQNGVVRSRLLSVLVDTLGAFSVGEISAGNSSPIATDASATCLSRAVRNKADLVVTDCFICFEEMNSYQRALKVDTHDSVPTLLLSQLAGVALGVTPSQLALDRVAVSPYRILTPFM